MDVAEAEAELCPALGGADVRGSGACEVWRASLPMRGRGFATGLKTVPPFSVYQQELSYKTHTYSLNNLLTHTGRHCEPTTRYRRSLFRGNGSMR